jgi:hypothetical protein
MHGTLALQQIGIFRMLVDIGFDEGALRDDLQALGSNLIQRALHQRRAGAFAAEFRGTSVWMKVMTPSDIL